jgi:hypothetical protein
MPIWRSVLPATEAEAYPVYFYGASEVDPDDATHIILQREPSAR